VHTRDEARAVTPAHVMVVVGADTSGGKVMRSKSPFCKGEDATTLNSMAVVAPFTKLSGVISMVLMTFTDVIVRVTPEVTSSMS
jgi:hypothetical protein